MPKDLIRFSPYPSAGMSEKTIGQIKILNREILDTVVSGCIRYLNDKSFFFTHYILTIPILIGYEEGPRHNRSNYQCCNDASTLDKNGGWAHHGIIEIHFCEEHATAFRERLFSELLKTRGPRFVEEVRAKVNEMSKVPTPQVRGPRYLRGVTLADMLERAKAMHIDVSIDDRLANLKATEPGPSLGDNGFDIPVTLEGIRYSVSLPTYTPEYGRYVAELGEDGTDWIGKIIRLSSAKQPNGKVWVMFYLPGDNMESEPDTEPNQQQL